ncbi:mannitol dehydrogenase family protein [Pseudoroseomonas globiformis]|uniref:Mannitol dehydrogenase family protein n=1 Tax=Teichococcus globiformis TaxID=2307229 RepID=A0ABV7FTN4_9PROT
MITAPRLHPEALLSRHPEGVAMPCYNRAALRPSIVHLGLGAFARAHLALYTEDVLNADGGDWGILGVSLQRPDQRDRLAPQDGLYTAIERGPDGEQCRIVGCLLGVMVAPEERGALVARLANPRTRIVSLTVTEKGYCHDPATGRLRLDHPDISHDLTNLAAPRTAIGFLVAGLAARRAAGHAPFTVLCCDNLPHNGRLVAGLVGEFADALDPALSAWIGAEGAFPCTMVDRIVPALTDADLVAAERLSGFADAAPVGHESFRQWVIEDDFVGGLRPEWEKAGAQFASDVAPFEHMKLRLLNGSHSALAYLGYLAGYETIGDAVNDDAFAGYLQRFWDEVRPMVPPPPGQDLHAYTDALLARFRNPAIRHRTWQIAMDGSQKLPQRLLGTLRERLAQGLDSPALCLAVAAWARYVGGTDEAGSPIDVRDPMAAGLRAQLDAAGAEPAARIRALLGVEAVFGTDLPAEPRFATALTEAYAQLMAKGARAAAAP